MSSRNIHLSANERAEATRLYRALRSAEQAVADGEREPAAVSNRARQELSASPGVELEYLELVSTDTMAPVRTIDGEVLAVLAARVGATRLIDNHIISGPLGPRGTTVRGAAPDRDGPGNHNGRP
jgi:pantoate--beta-alanine ligase